MAPTQLSSDSDPATVGAAVREATVAAREASGDLLVPAGTWRGEQPPVDGLPTSGVVTARRVDGDWVVTARFDARGGGDTGQPSSVQHALPAGATAGDLGQAVIEGLRADVGHVVGGEPPRVGEGQVLIEGEVGQLVIYPQEIDPETGAWETPAHSDVRTVFPGATIEQVGQAILLTVDEGPR